MALALEREGRGDGQGRGKRPTAAAAVPPYVNRSLILLCILSFVLRLPPESFAFVPAYFFGTVELAGPLPTAALWRGLFGHVLIHGDLTHLMSNMAVLWLLGDVVEREMGHGRYLLLFLGGTVAAALTEGLVATDRMAPLIGASGAICALMGGFLWLRPCRGLLSRRWLRRLVQGVIAAFAGLNAAMMLVPLPADSPLTEVGWGAHAGGVAAGLLLGGLLCRPVRRRRPPPNGA
ncbi:rhomboid family intramembrane serine protease [Azospirillum picis]|uniref:Membrane associated rhomboid family serine protease n=1 Tax=Azospirillum picis TaxID=488438 RepID=A0ABU0MFD9_9PROT|nr:rhomboid family intramembrane serine protease [Azospirillum picis]MBP2298801.1 membrane associated rhomboid family serine protease [Azospirillum picis]MDQ0532150.1 membrane associated rhomboid family serine protease [Azospirillum picis]